MRRKLLSAVVALLFTALGGVNSIFAQSWTGNDPVEGEYYLYSVKSGKFMHFGSNYGTRAVLVDGAGEIIKLEASGSNFKMTFPNINTGSKGVFLNGSNVPYCDNAAAEFTFEETSANSKIYTISTNGRYLACRDDFSAEPSPLETVDNANSENAQWKLVSRQDRINALANATKANPVDATFYIKGAEIDQCFDNASAWEGDTPDYGGRTGNYEASGFAAEYYSATGVKSYQNLSDLVNGKYVVSCYGFYRDGGNQEAYEKYQAGTEDIKAYLFAGNNKTPFVSVFTGAHTAQDSGQGFEVAEGVWVPNYMTDAVLWFFRGRYSPVTVESNVTDGTMTFGVSKDDGAAEKWTIWDRFRLMYYGPTIACKAVALPENGQMQADTWYYIDIAATADNYNATATTLDNIVYTSDGGILLEDQADVTANFTETDNSLEAIRYYVKSSSENTLTIEAASFSYNVGEATSSVADGSYTQSSVFSVTFASSSNDPDAKASIKAGVKVTVNGTEKEITAIENGFSVNLGELIANSDYVINIPAGIYGYEGESMNEQMSFTVHTPAIFDGTYYLYNPYTNMFLGRGNQYGTAAVVDKYGLPFTLETGKDNTSTLKFADIDRYLYNTYWLYADGENSNHFRIEASTIDGLEGYAFRTQELGEPNNRMYVWILDEKQSDMYRVAGNGTLNDNVLIEAVTVWQIKTIAEHDAVVNAYPTENIKNVAEASGIDDLETYLSRCVAEDKTAEIGTATFGEDAGSWTWNETREEKDFPQYRDGFARYSIASGSCTQTIQNLPAGIYKVTMSGFDRRTGDDTNLAGTYGSVGASYLKANDEQVRIMSLMEAAENYGSNPSTWAGQVELLNSGKTDNELYVYLNGEEDLTLTVTKPNYGWSSFLAFGNFTLTYYHPLTVAITEAGYATFSSEYALGLDDLPEGLEAYYVQAANVSQAGDDETGYVTLTEIDAAVEAGEGILLKGEAGTYDIPVALSGSSLDGNILIAGKGEKVAAGNYVFSCKKVEGEDVADPATAGFYKLGAETEVPKGKAYIDASQLPAGIKVLRFAFGDNVATAIETAEAADADAEGAIYNVAGQQVGKDYKGIVIKNGKKYLNK